MAQRFANPAQPSILKPAAKRIPGSGGARLAKLIGMSERSEDGAARFAAASGARRWLYLLLAGVFFALACLGIPLPGLPTTPFLLLTSYFLVRSSPALNRKLMQSKIFGPMLRDWQRRRALQPRVKAFSLVTCSAAILLSIFFGGLPPAGRALVAAAGAYGIWFVWRLPTIGNDPAACRDGDKGRQDAGGPYNDC